VQHVLLVEVQHVVPLVLLVEVQDVVVLVQVLLRRSMVVLVQGLLRRSLVVLVQLGDMKNVHFTTVLNVQHARSDEKVATSSLKICI